MSEFALPQAFIEIYPFEGGPYFLSGASIRSIITRSDIKAGGGTFEITLAPGGPNGVNTGPSWTEVITPMSFVLIGMRRAGNSQIVMLGVVTAPIETQEWHPDRSVERGITFNGQDFSYFFTTFSYYTLSFTGLTAGSAVGAALGLNAAPMFPQMLTAAFTAAEPDVIGQNFYTVAMAKPGFGVLGKTYVPYPASGQVTFWDATSTFFEKYPATVAFDMSYILHESSWLEKFRSIFPWPFYDCFVATAPLGFYGASGGQRAGYPFKMRSMAEAEPVAPVLVCRVNPLPMVNVTCDGPRQGGAFADLSNARWEGLPLFDTAGQNTGIKTGLIEQSFGFSAENARNYFAINPVGLKQIMSDNANLQPFLLNYLGAGDPASIARYGWRPEKVDSSWLVTQTGATAQDKTLNISQSVATLVARLFSQYEPEPLMARGMAVLPIRPDILPGCRFTCRPFKWEADWDFYVETVEQSYVFGGPSFTRLTLSRGLPSSVYLDASKGGVLYNVHIGNAMRQNGVYAVGLPQGSPPGLMTFGATAELQQFMAQLAPPWNLPQTP